MIFRLIMMLMGWRRFTLGGIQIYQRDILIDQTIISDALDRTKSIRSWCEDADLTVLVEATPFTGEYGAESTGEVSRYSKGRRTATVRVYGAIVTLEIMVDLLRGLKSVD